MTVERAIVAVTLRGLLGRRRAFLMILLAALPVVVGVLIRLAGGSRDAPEILDTLVVRTVLPLIALVIGTSTIGSEIEDGTAIFLLVKPVARWRIALAKTAVAAGLTAALIVPPVLLTGVLVSGLADESLGTVVGFAVAAVVGGTAYAAAFTTLGVLTSRALIIGLAYTLLWEGVLAGLLEGTRFLSIRQATLGLAEVITGSDTGEAALDPTAAGIVLVVVIAGAFALTTLLLARFQVRASD